MNAVALSGRGIEPGVYSAAQAIAGRAMSYAGTFINDPCVAANLMEEAVATVLPESAVRTKVLPHNGDNFFRSSKRGRCGRFTLDRYFPALPFCSNSSAPQ